MLRKWLFAASALLASVGVLYSKEGPDETQFARFDLAFVDEDCTQSAARLRSDAVDTFTLYIKTEAGEMDSIVAHESVGNGPIHDQEQQPIQGLGNDAVDFFFVDGQSVILGHPLVWKEGETNLKFAALELVQFRPLHGREVVWPVEIKGVDGRVDPNSSGRRLSGVADPKSDGDLRTAVIESEWSSRLKLDRNPRPLAGNQSVATDLVSLGGLRNSGTVGIKRFSHEPYANRRDQRAEEACKGSILGPFCLIPLGIKILLLPPLFAAGIWFSWRGLISGDYRIVGLFHTAQGVFRMLLGAAVATVALIGMLELVLG